ncbi:MAG: GNAT family N-acetyltransferase [Fusobacteriaceae bacterium]|jgi:phosphinothricin acetyltransferase|nr:GNAT family N-acetyltransferase [Fusobacteriaceae bacterium]
MKTEGMRMGNVADAREILAIYRPFVEKTYVSFETVTPTLAEFEQRIENFLAFYPYLVYLVGGKIAGYSYAHRFRERAAYDWDAETTIYTAEGCRRQGVGRKLYSCLEEILRAQQIKNLYAIVTTPNPASEGFHEAFGFTLSGVQHDAGFKFGRWYDSRLYEKIIGDHDGAPAPIIAVKDLDQSKIEEILSRY